MKKLLILSLVVLTGFAAGSVAQDEAPDIASMSDEELLGRMDAERFSAYFNPESPSTAFTVEIIAERPDGSKQATVQVSFAFDQENPDRGGARIDYLAPEELAGDVFIIKGDDIFFWNNDLISPLKVNGRFEVFGDATVAEVVGIGFQGSYTIESRADSALEDGTPAVTLELKATREGIAFQLAEVTANALTLQPHKLKLFDESGDLLHDNTFESYAMLDDGRPYFDRQLLDNRVVPVNQTLLIVSNIQDIEPNYDLYDPDLLGVE